MLKKIIVFMLIFSLNIVFVNAYLNKESKNKIDNVSKILFSKIEDKYNLTAQRVLLLKLNKKINKLKIENIKNTNNVEILSYLQNNVVEKTKEVTLKLESPMVNKTTVTDKTSNIDKTCNYTTHNNISASVFWVGEGADASNAYISNVMSAWDGEWLKHFNEGTENTFYVALPYNDYDENGVRRSNVKNIPWYTGAIKENESYVKNKWIKVEYNGKVAYGQWEDVGPLLENDFNYVFGTAKPGNTFELKAGIDLSPALAKYLGFNGSGNVNWNFITENCVPSGDWTKTITRNNINWK